ncbi:LysR substrate-binding domain-containing protein [Bacillus velezensis]|uniref:LysR substrate-binding domain-containing protein n=1 Tax=Bacillus amyloliquefaciens group TaxID=1938374 RepID=UPI0008F96333|nr:MULTISPECIES: LysR family transcriptional regulator [Bacillus amyloliquefaciens group]AUJ60222.1 LysR family transcriptional regulator [Bacillus velezensis]MCD7910617.1 LysR family transcriptional regulator [Bacillus velezensis]MCW5195228.1 HTH-type transcriptional activator CmpR [Bacillus amyloliquefaciens]MEC3769993.1 LysR family transcriptional regulator [Bacillus velezensis]MEC3847775.1 LysR family transcriptional regulator [Bacillus velezensis]
MELRTIKTFHTIVQSGSFYKAAEILNYSQPTISMRIKQLEQDVGAQLFERGKKLKLTRAGRLFHERAGQLLAQYEVLDHTLADIRQGQAGLIQIGISEPTASLIFPAVLRGFLNDYPDMSVNVSVDDANTCSRKLLEGAIDFAVCGEPELILENYFDPFFHDSLNVIVSDRHPLAAKASVNLEDLENECLIFTPANCPIRIQIEQHLQRAIGSSYRKMELTSSMAHQYYVRENIGVSIFTATAHSEPIEGTKVIPIHNLTISPPVGLLTNQKEEHFDCATKDLISRIISRFQRDPH